MNEENLLLFQDSLKMRNYSESTIKSYKSSINKFFQWNADNLKLTKDLLYNYFNHLTNCQNSYSHIKNSIISLKLYADMILGMSFNIDFLKNLKRPEKLPTTLSIEEVKKILTSIENLKHKAVLSLIYSCGLRISECIKLKIEDFDFSKMRIKITQSDGNVDRYVRPTSKLTDLLKEYFNVYQPATNFFQGRFKDEFSPKSIQNILKSALEKASINKNITVHSLRHSFATHLVEQGVDIRIIQKILGHKDIRTTQKYQYISSVNISNIFNPFESF